MTTECPRCKIRNNGHACISENGEHIEPTRGSISVCSRCGCICEYQWDFTLKEVSDKLLKKIKSEHPDDYQILVTASLYVIENILKQKNL